MKGSNWESEPMSCEMVAKSDLLVLLAKKDMKREIKSC